MKVSKLLHALLPRWYHHAWPVSDIRQRRSSHAPATVAHVVRPWRGHQLVFGGRRKLISVGCCIMFFPVVDYCLPLTEVIDSANHAARFSTFLFRCAKCPCNCLRNVTINLYYCNNNNNNTNKLCGRLPQYAPPSATLWPWKWCPSHA